MLRCRHYGLLCLPSFAMGSMLTISERPCLAEGRHKNRPLGRLMQLVLPFSIQGLNAATIQTKIEPKGVNRFEIRVNFEKAG